MREVSARMQRWMCFVRARVNQCLVQWTGGYWLVDRPARVAAGWAGGRMAGWVCVCGTAAGWLAGLGVPLRQPGPGRLTCLAGQGPIGFSLGSDSR